MTLGIAAFEDELFAFERIDLGARHFRERGVRVGEERLQLGVIVLRPFAGRTEDARLHRFERVERMVHDRLDLEAEGQHVGGDALLHDLIGIGLEFVAIGEALCEVACAAVSVCR